MKQTEAQKLVDDALASQAGIKDLYDRIDAASPITIAPSGEKTWASTTDAAGTTISVAPTAHPVESLAHELLHADLKLAGFRQYCTFLTVNGDKTVFQLASALDNELQHHRMFSKFVASGFDPTRFYHDGDYQTYDAVRTRLKRAKNDRTTAPEYFLMYLSVIAPGGAGTERRREQLERFFQMTVPKEKMALVGEAAAKLIAWSEGTDHDAGAVVLEIVQTLGDFDGWWIGASQDFPNDGYFTGQAFTMSDAQRYAASK
ncbi:MAG TPA: hypothetical protein VMN38_11655 [Sphingomicrobium sp.]|nr:hypothetical protein [Sphingomicrobium sp.]